MPAEQSPPAGRHASRVALSRRQWLLTTSGLLAAASSARATVPSPTAVEAFVYRADFPLAPHAALFGELRLIEQELVRVLAIPTPHETIELMLFGDETRYRNYLKARYPSLPYRRALYVKAAGRGTVFAYRGPSFAVDLRHETTHGLLHASLPMVPLWLDEGLAEYFEVAPHERASNNPHQKSLGWNLRLGMVPHLSVLEAKRDISEMSASDYRDAWAWVHFMLHGPPEAHQELVRFLADISQSAPPGRLSDRLEMRLPGVERRLVDHFRSQRLARAVSRFR